MTVRSLDAASIYRKLRADLEEHGENSRLDARVIFERVTGRDWFSFDPEDALSEEMIAEIDVLRDLRIKGYPLQYIAGVWPFLDFSLYVGEGVFIPRPDTESLALEAIKLLGSISAPRVVDLCAGTGCIGIAIARAHPHASVVAVEGEEAAFSFLLRNVKSLAPAVQAIHADVCSYQDDLAAESLDMVISNPPYVTEEEYGHLASPLYYEPKSALSDGSDGLSYYRHIAKAYQPAMRQGGYLLFEVGDTQAESVHSILEGEGYSAVRVVNDCFSNPRILVAEKQG